MRQVGDIGSGSLVGLWELSLERAKKVEEYRKRKKRRRKSKDIEILETSPYMNEEMSATPQELSPIENRFPDFTLAGSPVLYGGERPQSRGSRASRRASRSRSHSPTKVYTYRRLASPQKANKERTSKGIFHALRNLLSDWSNRHGHKLTHKKSKAGLNQDGNGINGKDVKRPLELKRSGESASKEELRRNRKGNPPNISILPPPERSPLSYADTESPARPSNDDESEGNGGVRLPRHNRPSYHRRRSTSSSINSLHSRHRYSHSRTSSTSSAGSGSVSTPRHSKGSLKIVPATPPPHLLSHEGAKSMGQVWGEGVVIARRRRSPFRGPTVGFMSGSLGSKRKGGQGKENGKWQEGAIKEEDEEVSEEAVVDDIEGDGDVEEMGRGSYDISELDGRRRESDVDGRSTSASV